MEIIEITLFLFNILLVFVIITTYVKLNNMVKNHGTQLQLILKNKEGFKVKEAMSPAQRFSNAAKYVGKYNGLLPEDKQSTGTSSLTFPFTNDRGDRSMSYLLPESKAAEVPAEPVQSALNVSPEDALKAGAGAIAGTDFDDNSIPSTEGLPAEVQSGVRENFCGANTRACPTVGPVHVRNELQTGGISTGKEGFRPRLRYEK